MNDFSREKDEIERLVAKYTRAKRAADKKRAKDSKTNKSIKESVDRINREFGFNDDDEEKKSKKKSKNNDTSKSDSSEKPGIFKNLKKVFDATMGERTVDDLYGFKYLKEKDFIKLKNALFGNKTIKSSADMNKFLNGAYTIAGAETELQKYKFFISHIDSLTYLIIKLIHYNYIINKIKYQV